MKVSIVIPAYNCEHFIVETLQSAQQQTYRDIEIIVVDDGSTDATAERVRELDGSIRYIRQENSGGGSRPRNTAIRAASGDLIALLDSDDLMLPDHLEHLVALLEAHPEIDLAFSDYRNFRGEEVHPPHSTACTRFARAPKTKLGEHLYSVPRSVTFHTLFLENPLTPSATVFRRHLVEKIGWFDETVTHSEDIDFFFRAARVSDFGYVDRPTILRRLHSQSLSANSVKMLTGQLTVYPRYADDVTDPAAKAAVRETLAGLFWSLGFAHRQAGQYGAACSAFFKSIATRPLPNRSYLSLVKTALASLPGVGQRPLGSTGK